jgi:mono/diheme cytochrome c family protein
MNKSVLTAALLLLGVTFAHAQTRNPAKPNTPAAKPTTKPAVKPAPKPATAAAGLSQSVLRGKTLYTTYCLACHQPDGLGVPNMNPPLSQTKQVLGPKPALAKILLNGMNTETEVNGEIYTNPMPAFNYLKDQEIADVLTFVRNNFGNKASMVTAAEVAAARKTK